MKTKVKNPLVYLFALMPIASALLFFLTLTIDVEVGILIRPIFKFSIVGVLAVLVGFFLTGFSGFVFGRSGVGTLKAILIGNAIPILAVVIYTVFVMIGKGDLEIAKAIGEFGNGMFSDVALYITIIAQRTFSYFEVYIAFAALILTFAVGYAVGAAKNNK